VRRGLNEALTAAGIEGRVRWHDLGHTAANLWIASGCDVAFVSRALGHASPVVTLAVCTHLFDAEAHADAARDALEQRFAATIHGTKMEQKGGKELQKEAPEAGKWCKWPLSSKVATNG